MTEFEKFIKEACRPGVKVYKPQDVYDALNAAMTDLELWGFPQMLLHPLLLAYAIECTLRGEGSEGCADLLERLAKVMRQGTYEVTERH